MNYQLETIEIKFKEKNQYIKWENLPVVLHTSERNLEQSIEWAKKMFQFVELRWNYAGSCQGHYVSGNVRKFE